MAQNHVIAARILSQRINTGSRSRKGISCFEPEEFAVLGDLEDVERLGHIAAAADWFDSRLGNVSRAFTTRTGTTVCFP